jgi:hypothetical protein
MPKKKLVRLPLPPSRAAINSPTMRYNINNIDNSFNGMMVWYWTASPEIFQGQIHSGFENANKNSQEGYSKVIDNQISINLIKPGAYMLKDKIIPPTIFYKIYNSYFGYGELQKIEV